MAIYAFRTTSFKRCNRGNLSPGLLGEAPLQFNESAGPTNSTTIFSPRLGLESLVTH